MNEIEYKFPYWGPFVMQTTMPKSITKVMLDEAKKTKRSYNHKLAGHLKHQYEYDVEIKNWFFQNITEYISAYRQGHCNHHGIKNLNVQIELQNLWVNFMKTGDFNPAHTHGGDYSFVLFLDVPDELEKEQKLHEGTSKPPGTLTFSYGTPSRPNYSVIEHHYNPKTGDFYMFPALLVHSVSPFKSDIERISISGNFEITNKKELPKDYV